MKGLLYQGQQIDDLDTYNSLPDEIQVLLHEINGYISYCGGFHLKGTCLEPVWHSIGNIWKGEFSLCRMFKDVLETDIPFAQDCMGDQFLYRDGGILRLLAETGDIENLDMDLPTFMNNVENDGVNFLQLQPLQQFYIDGGKLEPGQCLYVYPPFCFAEADGEISLDSIDTIELLLAHSRLACTIHDLPTGSKIDVRAIMLS